jgi:dTDP-4-dehydrorhamnose reductase
MRIAVTGTQGQVARSLIEAAAATGDAEIIGIGRPVLDLARPHGIAPALAAARPHVLVSAAAFTDTERAEAEPALAYAVNAEGAGALAAAAHALGIPVIHLSTDYVFDGVKPAPYVESDPIAPLCAYGRSNAAGEAAVAAAAPAHAILRSSWVYSPFGSNFVITMLRLAGERKDIPVVADQVGNPTAAADLAAGILAVARNLAAGRGGAQRYGTFHLAGQGAATWFELAQAVFAESAARGAAAARVVPIASADHRSRARRPLNSRLDCAKIAAVHGVELPPWQDSLRACVRRILEQGA